MFLLERWHRTLAQPEGRGPVHHDQNPHLDFGHLPAHLPVDPPVQIRYLPLTHLPVLPLLICPVNCSCNHRCNSLRTTRQPLPIIMPLVCSSTRMYIENT